jgi:hypothetical protein
LLKIAVVAIRVTAAKRRVPSLLKIADKVPGSIEHTSCFGGVYCVQINTNNKLTKLDLTISILEYLLFQSKVNDQPQRLTSKLLNFDTIV